MIRYPNLNEDVLAYDKLQTDEINKIKDWVVERVIGDTSYVKWDSGRLEMWTAIERDGNSPTSHNIVLPVPIYGSGWRARHLYNSVTIGFTRLLNETGGVANNNSNLTYGYDFESNSTLRLAVDLLPIEQVNRFRFVSVKIDGRWK